MSGRLFGDINWHTAQQQITNSAIAEVDALDDATLMNPSLAGTLEKIAQRYALRVPTLNETAKRGVRSEVERRVDDYGRDTIVNVPVIDVHIPFDGSAEAFRISPSTSLLLSFSAEITDRELIVTVYDNDRAQQEVDNIIKQIKQNLDHLRNDIAGLDLLGPLNRTAEARIAKIKAARDRDSKLDFPVS